jgi:hypothetical protein
MCEMMTYIFPVRSVVKEVVSGHAAGADRLGERWAKEHDIPVKLFLPNWEMYGKKAGPIRNAKMAEYGWYCMLFWDGKSRGSKNMMKCMHDLGKPCYDAHIKKLVYPPNQ